MIFDKVVKWLRSGDDLNSTYDVLSMPKNINGSGLYLYILKEGMRRPYIIDHRTVDLIKLSEIVISEYANSGDGLTYLSLQRVMYILNLLFYIATDSYLINSKHFHVWEYGPVIPELWRYYEYIGAGNTIDSIKPDYNIKTLTTCTINSYYHPDVILEKFNLCMFIIKSFKETELPKIILTDFRFDNRYKNGVKIVDYDMLWDDTMTLIDIINQKQIEKPIDKEKSHG